MRLNARHRPRAARARHPLPHRVQPAFRPRPAAKARNPRYPPRQKGGTNGTPHTASFARSPFPTQTACRLGPGEPTGLAGTRKWETAGTRLPIDRRAVTWRDMRAPQLLGLSVPSIRPATGIALLVIVHQSYSFLFMEAAELRSGQENAARGWKRAVPRRESRGTGEERTGDLRGKAAGPSGTTVGAKWESCGTGPRATARAGGIVDIGFPHPYDAAIQVEAGR